MKKFVLFLFIFCTYGFSQSQMSPGMNTDILSSALSQSSISPKPRDLSGNYYSIDENEYIVDSGDEFYIKIDITGPEIKTYNIRVSSDGNIYIPNAPGIYVRGLKLTEAKKLVFKHLKKYFHNADIEIFLEKIHSIHVYLTGALNRYKTIELHSGNRLYDVLENIVNDYQMDTLLVDQLKIASLRNITLKRGEKTNRFDMLQFRQTGNGKNPYLMNDDIIYVPYRDTTAGDIMVRGMVGSPITFEFKEGDKLGDAIVFAGDLLPSADSSNIMLYRYIGDKDEFRFLTGDFISDKDFTLRADDRIYVRRKPLYRNKTSVMVSGFVKYPGEYPIIPYKTTLADIINQAGGVTKYADLSNSRLLRVVEPPGTGEIERLNQSLMTSMTRIERDFWSNSTRENLAIINCDFSKIINDKDPEHDVILFPDDLIEIMGDVNYVYVSGAVVNPGMIVYNENWTYKEYIEAAGGFKERAKKYNVKLIKSQDENWLDVRKGYSIEKGDRLFIPQRTERDLLSYTVQTLSILSQFATIVLVLTSFKI